MGWTIWSNFILGSDCRVFESVAFGAEVTEGQVTSDWFDVYS